MAEVGSLSLLRSEVGSLSDEGIHVAEKDEHATLNYPGGELELDIVGATEGSDGIALGSLLAKTGYTTFDDGFVNTAATKSAITYIDGDAGILRYRGISDRAARREVELHRGQLPADLRRAADQGAAGQVHRPDPAAHAAARGSQAVLRRLPAQRASDAGGVQRGERAVRVLPGFARPVRRRAGRAVHHPAAGQAADHRGVRLQEVGRAAVPVPGQLADAGGELPADDVRLPGRALRGGPRDRAGAGPAADPACRPRAELLDVDGAAGRFIAGQPVHLDLGRHQRAVGPAARRRQPGRAGDAREDPPVRRRRARLREEGQEQAKTASS